MNGVIITIILVLCGFGESLRLGGKRGAIEIPEYEAKSGSPFDYLMLTLIYPEAVCRADDDTVPDSCAIPKGTPKWSIHGLWPNYNNGSYPQFCPGEPKKFDLDGVKPIINELTLNWPNLFPDKSVDSFWKHEWEKHGTCAEYDQKMDSELKYFNSTIYLHSQFNVERSLNDEGVLPSQDPYTYNQIIQAFTAGLTKGKRVQIHCLTDKKTHQTLLADVRLCLDLNFHLIDCPREGTTEIEKNAHPHHPPLPGFKPCRDMITYLPSTEELKLEKFTEIVMQVSPASVILSMRLPLIALPLTVLCLIYIIVKYSKKNWELIKQYRILVTEEKKNVGEYSKNSQKEALLA